MIGLRLTLSKRSIIIGVPTELRTETDPGSETLCSLIFRIQVENPSNSEDFCLRQPPHSVVNVWVCLQTSDCLPVSLFP
jgi:hypothetical protein